ncbi:(2Fe-2S)-binding protein [Streptomyces sp. NPDC001315]|uniref:(2Fe-2S)-binding protein n=1 Tax=Streptomyces sp. NPDC001315 TaxID=3364562 RepID=UPI0036842ECF
MPDEPDADGLTEISLTVNGESVTARVPADQRLVDFLRDELGLSGTKIGCEVGFCGVCSVLLDGTPAGSCHTLTVLADGRDVVTAEGLAARERAGELRRAFIEEGAFQCGFCTSGQLVMASALVDTPDAGELTAGERASRMALTLCRCTGYYGIQRAIDRVLT